LICGFISRPKKKSAKKGFPVEGAFNTSINENTNPITIAPARLGHLTSYNQVYGTILKQPSKNQIITLAGRTSIPLIRYFNNSPVDSCLTYPLIFLAGKIICKRVIPA
jgi:hypothetical protein